MIIVDFDKFIKMPEGTVYSFYNEQTFTGLYIKVDTISNTDWWYKELVVNPDSNFIDGYITSFSELEKGNSVPIDTELLHRDGMFDYDREFAIYETEDIKQLITELILNLKNYETSE